MLMKLWISIMMSAVTGLAAAKDAGEALLDKMIAFPGSYSQVCDVMTAPQDIPYRAYVLTDFAGASFSKANQQHLETHRDALVKAIRARLLEIDFNRAPKDPGKDPKPEESFDGDDTGCDPASLNPLLLDLILKLKATEALPELLVVEDKLVKAIARAKDDVKAPAPRVDGWHVGMENFDWQENEPQEKRDRRIHLFNSRVAQRDLVMTMGKLMRERAFAPYLATSLEKAFVKGIRKQAKEEGFDSLKPGQPLPKKFEGHEIGFDSVTKLPFRRYMPVMVPYSRESRDEVRAAAAKWIAAHP
jgi:hypothetical protein